MVKVTVDKDWFDPQGFDRGGLPTPGKGHYRVEDIEVRNGRNGQYLSVKCTILAHEDASNVGKTTYNTFTLSGKGVNRLLTYCQACGVVTKEQVARFYQDQGEQFSIPAEETEGKTFCGTLEAGENPNNGKKTCKVEFDFVNPMSDEAADYPKEKDALPGAPPENPEDVPF